RKAAFIVALAKEGGSGRQEQRRAAGAVGEEGGRRRVAGPGGDAVIAEEAAEAEAPVRPGHAGGTRVPDGADQLMQEAKGGLGGTVAPQQAAALFAVAQAVPDDADHGRMGETERVQRRRPVGGGAFVTVGPQADAAPAGVGLQRRAGR